MADRDALFPEFLARAGWGAAGVAPLAGDASNRRYLRLTHPDGRRAVLMDAPPEKGEDVRPFVRIARHLLAIGLSAPQILARDDSAGLLLLEDLGDALYAREVAAQPQAERPLYAAAVDALTVLHAAALPDGIAAYDPATMGPLAGLAIDWYLGGAGPAEHPTGQLSNELSNRIAELTAHHAGATDTLILRDYHAENLIWLPDRTGPARVGQLDFQDAMAGHGVYDLVSLLQDARRDVTPTVVAAMKTRFLDQTGAEAAAFDAAYVALGAQRALRILGVFARLCLRDGKAHYVDLIPRVWTALQTNLTHPALSALSTFVAAHLPPPSPDLLNHLKAQCSTHPTPP